MSSLSTHVLDAVDGAPAAGLAVVLERRDDDGAAWVRLGEAVTDADGRVRDVPGGPLRPGVHRLVFDTGTWSAAHGRPTFYPEVGICFAVTDEPHLHVPLLLSPYSYSTYRGS